MITDFNADQGDKIDLTGLLANASFTGPNPFAAGYLMFGTDSGGNAQILADYNLPGNNGWWLVADSDDPSKAHSNRIVVLRRSAAETLSVGRCSHAMATHPEDDWTVSRCEGVTARRPPGPITERTAKWLWPVLVLAAVAALGVALVLVAEIASGRSLRLDSRLLLALRRHGELDVPIGPPWMLQSAIDISALGGFTLQWLLGAACVLFLLIIRQRSEAVWLTASIVGASLLDFVFKLSLHRPRPELVPHLARVSNASFPSGHAMISAAIYLTVATMLAEAQASPAARVFLMGLAVTLVLLIGISRVYLGVHWPSDVLAGWCFGSVWALLVFAANRALRRRVAHRQVFHAAPTA